jgi:NAD(P)H dehydrogenase (quinone)
MPNIVISGASGDLGEKVTQALLKDLPPEQLKLVSRTPQKLAGTVPDKVKLVAGDYDQPEGLVEAYRGSDVLFLISAMILKKRVGQHRNAIDAAVKAGIKHIVYTSYVGVHPQNPNLAASDHIRTEADVRASGLQFTILRDATYADWVHRLSIQPALRTGKWVQIKGNGRFAPIAKEDVVRAATRVLLEAPKHAGAVYELSGPELFSFRQIAELASEVFNTPLEIQELSPEERLAYWDALGVPRDQSKAVDHPDTLWISSDELVTGEAAIAQQGFQAVLTDHVQYLTGRKPRPFRSVLEEIAREEQTA